MADWNPAANEIFANAVEIDDVERRLAYLDSACAGDARLRQIVDGLLQAHVQAGSFLDGPAVTAAPPKDESATAAITPEKSGTIIGGRFKLLQQIAEGGMGTVWMAEQFEPVRRQVAVKVIKPGMDSGQVLARFEAERQALALMDHPNIARVLDAGTSEAGRPFFVMELVRGMVITKYCDEKRLNLRQRLELMIPVCQAVQHAHQKGIIHRDLKPSNVLIALYDGKPVPKVIDFGVAKAMGQQLTERTLFTGYGSFVGTLEYMSPEQAELNQLDIDTRSDIYSLGVLLYELLTGSTPLDRKQIQRGALLEILRLIREAEPPTPSTRLSTSENQAALSEDRRSELSRLSKSVRGEVDWIVMKALDKDRNRRYETANGFAQDIQRYLVDEPVLASPPSASYRLRKFVKRNRGPVLAAAALLLAILGGIVGTTIGLIEAQNQRDDAEQAREDEAIQKQYAVDQSNRAESENAAANLLRQRAEEDKATADKLRQHAEKEEAAAVQARKDEAEHRQIAEKEKSKANDLRVRAEKGEAEVLKRLAESQQNLFTAQIGRAAGLWQSGPGEAKMLLRDLKACPPQLRDFTWHLYHRMCERERTVFPDLDFHQSDDAVCTAISPDGKMLAAGGALGTIQLWDFASGKLLQKFVQNKGRVDAVCFSKDGKTLMAAETLPAADKTWVHRWDVAGGNILGSKDFTVKVKSLALHPDGKWMVTGHYQNNPKPKDPGERLYKGEAVLWNLEPGDRKELLRDNPAGILCVAFTTLEAGSFERPISFVGNDHLLVIVTIIKTKAKPGFKNELISFFKLWDLTTGTAWELTTGKLAVLGNMASGQFAVSADGQSLATASASEDGKTWQIRVWNVAERKEWCPPVSLPKTTALALALTADHHLVAATDEGNLVKFWPRVKYREPLKDFTDIKLADFGIKPIEPKKDPTTGFIVGGKNATDLIKGLEEINGKSIADLEKIMRPGASSGAGFLGKDEKLLDVMAADNSYVVDELGLTHQDLARHLHAMGAIPAGDFLYHGRKFNVERMNTDGFQDSPFADGTRSGNNVVVHNLSNGKKLMYALLVPFMVERYGFYEGKGTSYRLDPRQVIEVFDFVIEKKKKD